MKINDNSLAFGKMKNNVTDRELTTSYSEELKVLGYTSSTVYIKLLSLEIFKRITQKRYEDIKVEDINLFVSTLKEKGLHPHTIEHYYCYTEQFYLYLERKHIINNNPFNYYSFRVNKQNKKIRDILTQNEIETLYQSVKTIKEKILLHLCYGCGLRALEVQQINLEDVKTEQNLVIVTSGKNNQYRAIPITKNMSSDFIKYLRYRRGQSTRSEALLLNEKGTRLRTYSARKMLNKLLKRSGVNEDGLREITLHSLRHSIATHLLENGMPVAQVQQLLGHKQMETTEIYTRVCKRVLRTVER